MIFRKYSWIVLLLCLFCEIQVSMGGRKKKKPPVVKIQVKYNTTDTTIKQLLEKADVGSIQNVEATFFVRIASTKYILSTYPMNYFKAYQMCRLQGGYLIDSIPKFKEISSYVGRMNWPGPFKFWIGITCLAQGLHFRWFHSGEELGPKDFSWAPGEPASEAETCVLAEKIGQASLMRTVECDTKALAICEVLLKHKPNPAGPQIRKKKKTMRMHSLFS